MKTPNPLADDAPTDLEDRALVERARAGDRDALEGLVRHHQGWIYNIAVRMVFHPQDAEDATQFVRPGHSPAGQIDVEAADASDALRLRKPAFTLGQFVLRLHPVSDVLGDDRDTVDLAGCAD